ncbi:Na+/H+ antiporter subunit E [Thermohalobacter berrensis]|uniref:Sodium:proton antiporter n=1 Tax=Thermohalobacter berrensis TaxID=99594 RepID=A0A419SZ97_9FIRM|nr:Na+/H+ antiporter subunit E [Thermohalobacter berrensis]RKD30574.1 hypothetical protein BET03_04350 [Thermohalobacter berrensis]
MYKKKISYRLFIVLVIFWIMFTLDFSMWNLIAGVIVSYIISRLSFGIYYDIKGFKIKIPRFTVLIQYSLRLICEIYKASFFHIFRIIKKEYAPMIVEIELSTTDPLIITIIANSITLTPGTITIDSYDNKLLVLSIENDGEFGKSIERNIKDKFESILLRKDENIVSTDNYGPYSCSNGNNLN